MPWNQAAFGPKKKSGEPPLSCQRPGINTLYIQYTIDIYIYIIFRINIVYIYICIIQGEAHSVMWVSL